MDDLKVVYLSPKKLKAYENNTRKHQPEDIEGIKESIRRVGFLDPIGIWGKNNLIVEGHGRQIAAMEMGLDRVPCIRLDHLTEEQRKDYAIRHNRTAEMSSWDFGKLEEELAALELQGVDMSDLKFDVDFDVDIGGAVAETDIMEDEPPEPPETAIAKPGQIWQLGRHRLMCGDSTDSEAVSNLMDGNIADIAITSPPYGESSSAKLRDHYVPGAEKRKSLYIEHEDGAEEWRELVENAFESMRQSSNGQFINIQMLADNKRDLIRIISNHINQLCDVIVWDKGKAPPQMGENVLNNEFEFVFVFGKENATRAIPFGRFHGSINNIIRLTPGKNEFANVHRAVFPVEFPAKIMEIANTANSVLDLFGGTGTTLIACEQLGRKCYMMELDPHYCDVIIQRWENLTGEKAVLLNG